MPNTHLLWVENMLARAHKTIWAAVQELDRMTYHTTATDLEQVIEELERIQISLLRLK